MDCSYFHKPCRRAPCLSTFVALAEQRRLQYRAYQPVFWRNGPNVQQVHAPFLAKQLGNDAIIALVYQAAATVQGFVVASVRGG